MKVYKTSGVLLLVLLSVVSSVVRKVAIGCSKSLEVTKLCNVIAIDTEELYERGITI